MNDRQDPPVASRRAVLGGLGTVGVVGLSGSAAATTGNETPSPEPGSDELRWSLDVGGLDLRTELVENHLITEEGAVAPLRARDVRTGEVSWKRFPEAQDFAYDDGLFGVRFPWAFAAVSPASGEVDWRIEFDDATDDVVRWDVHEGIAYLGFEYEDLVAVEDGSVLWRTPTSTAVTETEVAGDVLLVEHLDGLNAVDRSDGTVLWRQSPPGYWIMRWHLDGDVVYVDGEFPVVRARALADGAERWRYEADTADYATWFAIDDGLMYVQERGDAITALDAADGSVAWRQALPVPEERFLTNFLAGKVPGEDVVYLLTSEDDVLALDAADGSRRWRADTGVDNDEPRNRFVHLSSGLYLLVWDREDGRDRATVVLRLDGGDGGPRWSREVDGDVNTLELPAEDHLLVGASESVLALDPTTGEHRWPRSVRDDLGGDQYDVVDGVVYGLDYESRTETTAFARPLDGEWEWTTTFESPDPRGGVSIDVVEETMLVTYEWDGTVLALDANLPAIPAFDVSPAEPDPGETVTFDAGATTDPEGAGESLDFAWDFDDGSTATGRTVKHGYESAGWYEVILTVTDVDGDEASTTSPVSVGGATEPPTDASTPGFGLGVAGLGVGAVAAWLARRGERG